MSLVNIPFQPVQFGLDSDFALPVRVNDPISFQVELGLCDGASDVVVNGDFAAGLADWPACLAGAPAESSGVVTFGANQCIQQNIPNAQGNYFLVEIQVVDVATLGDNGLLVGWMGPTVQPANITEAGNYQFVLQGSFGNFRIICAGQSAQISNVKIYEWFSPSDIDVNIVDGEDSVVQPIDSVNILMVQNRAVVNFNWPDIEGNYAIRVTVCDEDYYSNWFCAGNAADTVLIFACNDSDAFGLLSDGFSPSMRVMMDSVSISYPSLGRELYVDSAGFGKLTFAEFEKTKRFQTIPLPEWVVDWLAILAGYSSVFIDGQKYRFVDSEVSVEPVAQGDKKSEVGFSHVASFEVSLDGLSLLNVKCDDFVRNCTPPPNCWLWADGTPIVWEEDEEDCILMNL